jgi:hypothetical protein
MKVLKLALPLLITLVWAGAAHSAKAPPPACKPCGAWELDPANSEPVDPAIDAALARYKPPRPRRLRASPGDIVGETEAEFEASLDRMPGMMDRSQLRDELKRLLQTPESLDLRQEGGDVVIEAKGSPKRRITPGEPHARVDARGTAEISSRWRSGALNVNETYTRKSANREVYLLEAGQLRVTRTVTRPGLPDVVVRSTYKMR